MGHPAEAGSGDADAVDRREVAIERLRDAHRDIVDQLEQIEHGYAALTEAMAVSARRLAAAAQEADFSPPPWPAGIGRTIEVRLAQTREVTFRLGTEADDAHSPPV